MTRQAKEFLRETALLWAYSLTHATVWAASAADGSQMPAGIDIGSRFAFPLVLAAWVTADARKRGHALCYDFDSFVFLAWPVVLPCYLFQTRGLRAFIALLCFGGIWLCATGFGYLIAWLF
ncbi:MAG: hypothetical protein HYY24_09970 [Verrucomicrobia bacterium]|nr:hypothetical protein [Verrucomicrobiota bacterium]